MAFYVAPISIHSPSANSAFRCGGNLFVFHYRYNELHNKNVHNCLLLYYSGKVKEQHLCLLLC